MRTDPQRLKQILLNLVANAAKFTTDGTITLSLTADRTSACFMVADDGIGVASDKVNALFEPFVQVAAATGGTGLGLSICHQFTHLLGGEIDITSAPAKGMTVRLYFPLNRPPEKHTATVSQCDEAAP